MANPIALHGKVIEQVCENDRVWFEQHPCRAFRIRDAVPFEFNAPMATPRVGQTWRTLVARLADGVRMRSPVGLPVEAINEGAADEHLRRLFYPVAPDAKQLVSKARPIANEV